jgi:hypothetical protein
VPRTTIVAVALLIGLLAGIALEPDSGTAASVGPPDITGLSVGANHAKPLPKPLSVADILRSALPTVLLMALLLQRPLWVSSASVGDDDALPRPVRRALARARRGPPATL